MVLSSLFLRNAALCVEMASAAKSAEVREQWLTLANQWQQKAEADQLLTGTPISPEPLAPLSPSRDLEEPCQEEKAVQEPTPAPTLVPLEPQLPTAEDRSQVPIENIGEGGAPEDLWSQLITDIRTQGSR
jgi:hypothetical protein